MKSDGKHLQSELDRIVAQRPTKVNLIESRLATLQWFLNQRTLVANRISRLKIIGSKKIETGTIKSTIFFINKYYALIV